MKTFYLLILFVSSLLFLFLSFCCFRLLRSIPSGDSPDADSDSDADPTDLRSRWRSNKNIGSFPYSSDDEESGPAPSGGFVLSHKVIAVACIVFLALGLGLLNAAIYLGTH